VRFGRKPTAPGRRRRISRREREERQKRQLYWGMGIAGALIAVILVGFAVNEYVVKPRHVMATVDGTKIRRKDYWKVRSYDLLNQASQFQQLATFADSEQQQQYQSLAQQALLELEDVWGSTSTNDATLSKMIDDQVYLKNLDSLNLTVTDQDVDDYIAQQFEPANAPIFTPTPTATLIPTRAAWATETAVSQNTTATANAASLEATPEAAGSPEAAASPEGAMPPAGGTPEAAASPSDTSLPEAEAPAASPAVAPEASPEAATPDDGASPEASPSAEATVSPTPNQDQARQTAAAGYELFQENAFDVTHMSQADYERLIVRPLVARQKVRETLEAQVGQSAEQVHAAHILVSTKELADSIYQQLQQPGADFGQIAKDQSTDTATAPNGGDLGWFPRGIMVPEFDAVAFATAPGQVSQPFESEFGWHIVKVFALEPDRPMTDEQISQLKSSKVQNWLDEQKAAMDISSELQPTPTPADRTFEPPPDAPPTPTPAPTAVASPEASPQAE
jgi:peptidyl-prolyl cis-trans isomerase C